MGALLLAVLIAVPLLAATGTFLLLPSVSAPDHEARARVNVSDVTGAISSFDVATQAADFAVAYYSQVELATGENRVSEMLDTSREGESAFVTVSFLAESESVAVEGLRRATEGALDEIVAQRLRDAERRLDGAEFAYDVTEERATAVLDAGGATEGAATAIGADALVRQSANNLAIAQAAAGSARAAQAQVGEIVQALDVSVAVLTDLEGRIQLAAVAGLAGFFLIAPVAFLHGRGKAGRDPLGSHRRSSVSEDAPP